MKYKLLEEVDQGVGIHHLPGSIVYDLDIYDFGFADAMERAKGEPFKSVTISDLGDGPGFQVPIRILKVLDV